MTTPSKIKQGHNGKERLYTVRPRNSKAVTDTRGNPSSITFHLPPDLASNTDKYKSTMTPTELKVFEQAANHEGLGFINFIAQSTSYSIQEKSQIMHTFGGKEAVYFYGRAPVMVQLSGTIVDDIDNDQFAQFLAMYNKFARGSSAAKDYAYVTLSLNNAKFVGSFMNISIQQSSDRDTDVTFSAQFLAKTFTIASSDTVFQDSKYKLTSEINVRDEDPTLTKEVIAEAISKSLLEMVVDFVFDVFSSTPDLTVASDSPERAERHKAVFQGVPNTFGKLPQLDGLVTFSAADVTEFFDVVNEFVDDYITPALDLIAAIVDFVKAAITLIEAVEQAFDDILDLIKSVVNFVYGVIDTVTDLWTKLVNFPKSISDKIGSFGKSGGSPIPIAGSTSISSGKAMELLSSGSNIGSARGTPEGQIALLSITSAKLQAQLQSNEESAGITTGNKVPSLSLPSGTNQGNTGQTPDNPGFPGFILPPPILIIGG